MAAPFLSLISPCFKKNTPDFAYYTGILKINQKNVRLKDENGTEHALYIGMNAMNNTNKNNLNTGENIMNGSEKQIKWAEDIKASTVKRIRNNVRTTQDDVKIIRDAANTLLEKRIMELTDAKKIIEHRNRLEQVVAKSVVTELLQAHKEIIKQLFDKPSDLLRWL